MMIRTVGCISKRQIKLIPKKSTKHATILIDGKPIGTAWDVVLEGYSHDGL